MKIGDIIHYPRCMNGHFDLCELKIRTAEDDWFVGVDKRDKHAYLFSYHDIGKSVFLNRSDAIELVKKAEAKYKEEHKDDVVNDEEEWL